jgi:hypothetical protein
MSQVAASCDPALRSFVTGLRRDQDAVTAGLTLRWSSGAVEGHVNRIKMLKRQMYGRANPDLLRRRVLLATNDQGTRHGNYARAHIGPPLTSGPRVGASLLRDAALPAGVRASGWCRDTPVLRDHGCNSGR